MLSFCLPCVCVLLALSSPALAEDSKNDDKKNKTNLTVEKDTFETDMDGWSNDKGGERGWTRVTVDHVKEDHKEFPHPPDGSSDTILVPSSGDGMSLMHKTLMVPASTDLEVFFTCVVVGYDKSDDPSVRLNNPVLQVLYDDVLVFHLETAITENTGHYANGKWNQFRLFSSYKTNFTMTATFMGSSGSGSDKLVALDNVVIKMRTNGSVDNIQGSNMKEPKADLKEPDGEWEEIKSKSLEEEAEALKNKSGIAAAPAFCDLLAERGPCLGAWPRYYYNPETNSCDRFVYGGCDGNENNFHVKLACEAICKKPNETEDKQILGLDTTGKIFNLTLDFDDGYGAWSERFWRVLRYDSPMAKVLKISAHNKSSTCGGSPIYKQNTIFSRPRLLHPLDLLPHANLTMQFSLKLIGSLNPALHPFFEHMNPGFKIYIGDDLMFDYGTSGSADDEWHEYSLTSDTADILKFPHLQSGRGPEQLLRIEAWQGSGEHGYIVLDDFSVTQIPISEVEPISGSQSRSGGGSGSGATTEKSTTAATKALPTMTIRAKTHRPFVRFPCNLPVQSGPCKARLTRYYHNAKTNRCVPFSYGGCKGNANNFPTMAMCIRSCEAPKSAAKTPTKTTPKTTTTTTTTPPSASSGTTSPHPPSFCSMPEDPGRCKTFSERYYFDHSRGECRIFVFGGCGGNANNFESKSDCQRVCMLDKELPKKIKPAPHMKKLLSDCQLPISAGDCANGNSKDDDQLQGLNMFAFDDEQRKCVNFKYSGCGGNENLFFTLEECNKTCGELIPKEKIEPKQPPTPKEPSSTPPPPQSTDAAVCELPQESVHCVANESTHAHWFYSKAKGLCLEEQSCSSRNRNKNQFESLFECKKTCQNNNKSENATSEEEEVKKDDFKKVSFLKPNVVFEIGDCLLTPSVGECDKEFSRFYYDSEQNECLEFRYSGCRGNKNNFMTHRECVQTCVDAERKIVQSNVTTCEQPKEVGPCKHKLTRYFFNTRTDKCEEFEYGGCRGNKNRFFSLLLCQSTCETPLVEKAVVSDERRGATAASVAETVLGVVLCLLAIAAVALGVKYYKIRQAKENYRIFNNERNSVNTISNQQNIPSASGIANSGLQRSNSTSSTATLPRTEASLAYDNPTYEPHHDDILENDRDNDEYNEPGDIRLNGTSFAGSGDHSQGGKGIGGGPL